MNQRTISLVPRLFQWLLVSLVLLGSATSGSRQPIPTSASVPTAWITFTIRNTSLRSIDQMICFLKPGQPMHPLRVRQYHFGPFSTQTFTYPIGTKVECVQRVDLQGRPQTVYLLAILAMRDQGRTFKLSL